MSGRRGGRQLGPDGLAGRGPRGPAPLLSQGVDDVQATAVLSQAGDIGGGGGGGGGGGSSAGSETVISRWAGSRDTPSHTSAAPPAAGRSTACATALAASSVITRVASSLRWSRDQQLSVSRVKARARAKPSLLQLMSSVAE